jgi:hypothetical protein
MKVAFLRDACFANPTARKGSSMDNRLKICIAAFATSVTACSAGFETEESVIEEGTLLAQFARDGHSVAIFRAKGDTLLVQQETPALSAPLLKQHSMAGRLPSEVFAEISGEPAPAVLLEAEREFGIEREPIETAGASDNEIQVEVDAEKERASLDGPDDGPPMHVRQSGDTDFIWFAENFCANRADIRAVFTPDPPSTPELAWAIPRRTSDRLRSKDGVSWGYVAGFNMGSSGTIITKASIDNQWGQGVVTQPRTVQQQWWFSGWREVCGPFGLGCFKIPNERHYDMGITGFDSGDVGAGCGFYW